MRNKNDKMKFLYESDIYGVVERIDNVYNVVTKRLIPAFSSIQEEAENVEKNRLDEMSRAFDPEHMDESTGYEDAYHAGIHHIQLQNEMENEFINSALTWIFHLFEKSCTEIFGTECGNKKREILQSYGIDTSPDSDWHKCNKEMRILANAIKHGPGPSHTEAEKLRPDLFRDSQSFLTGNRICVPEVELDNYKNIMRSFWVDFFTTWWNENMNGTLKLPTN